MPQEDLVWALSHYKSNLCKRYATYEAYYRGDQPLAFATDKFRNTFGSIFREFAENLCSPVVDALSDRLEITGFKTNMGTVTQTQERTSAAGIESVHTKVERQDPVADQCYEIWTRNRMDLKAGEVHTESLKLGDAYVIVWPGENNEAEIWPQAGWNCHLQYDPNVQGRVLKASKVWWNEIEKHWYLNLYYPERIEKYVQQNTAAQLADNLHAFAPYEVVNNPYGQVPVFHFPNARVRKNGVSELQGILPIQDGLNKACMDMIIAMEFASFKQRYVIGLEVEVDETTGEPMDPTAKNYGVDRLLAISDPDAKVGQWDATDLSQFLRVQEKFWASAARISGTPLHYFFITQGDFPSGEAMKSAEARFVKKIKDRQTAFGNVWEDVLKFCLLIDHQARDENLVVSAEWVNASPRSEAEIADTAVKKKSVGVSRSQILRELGYDEEEISQMLQESDADAMRSAEIQAKQNPQNQNGSAGQRGQSKPGQAPQGAGKGVAK